MLTLVFVQWLTIPYSRIANKHRLISVPSSPSESVRATETNLEIAPACHTNHGWGPWLGMALVPEHWAVWMEVPGWVSVNFQHSFCCFVPEYLRANLSGKNFLFNLNLIHSTLWLIWMSGILWLWTAFYFQQGKKPKKSF